MEKTRITIPRHSQPGILLPSLSDGQPFVRYAAKRTPEPYQIQPRSIICERHRAVLKQPAPPGTGCLKAILLSKNSVIRGILLNYNFAAAGSCHNNIYAIRKRRHRALCTTIYLYTGNAVNLTPITSGNNLINSG